MKKRFLFLILLIINLTFICEIQAQDDWFWQNPLPQGDELYGIKFISATVDWVVGEDATIIKTTNGGTSWYSQTNSSNYYIIIKAKRNL